MSKDNGGPAFPSTPMTETELSYGRDMGRSTTQVCNAGMSMRDYFAGLAMQGLVSFGGWNAEYVMQDPEQRAADSVSEAAYKYADAMLEERKK